MKRIANVLMLAMLAVFSSCESETLLIISESVLNFERQGGSVKVTLVSNKVWKASSSQSWCKVSPTLGDGENDSNFTLSITCDANQSYDNRTCQITITSEEKTSTITVNQSEGKGVVISQTNYSVSNAAQSVTVDVQSNLDYSVTVDDSAKQWIDIAITKGLSSSKLIISITENEGDKRIGKATIKAAGISDITISVEQESAPLVQFQDSRFKSLCTYSFDKNKDGVVSCAEALLVTEMNFPELGITNLSGIEYFTNLTKLRCDYNYIKSIDLSKNTSLVELECTGNNITSLIVRGCAELKKLVCDNNYLETLDVSSCTSLTELRCNNNTTLTNLVLGDFPHLELLTCGNCNLTTLDASKCPSLVKLNCSKNPSLERLLFGGKASLESLYCSECKISNIDATGFTKLSIIESNHNQLTSLSVGGCTSLTSLYCGYNQLGKLDVSECKRLTTLWCPENALTILNVDNCISLSSLYCSYNQLSRLDVSGCVKLSLLYCNQNPLTYLNASGCPINDLDYGITDDGTLILSHTKIKIIELPPINISTLDLSGCKELTFIYFREARVSNLIVSGCTSLTSITAADRQMVSLDVSGCTSLGTLECENNKLTSINISGCTKLGVLNCSQNLLTNLDVSDCSSIYRLWCYSNPYLKEIWLKTGQSIYDFIYDTNVATIKYK